MSTQLEYPLGSIADELGLELDGKRATPIRGLATLANAKPGDLSFFHNPRYYSDLLATGASALIIHPDYADKFPGDRLLSDNPYVAYARVSRLFTRGANDNPGIHSTVTVHPDARLGEGVSLHANVVIGAGVVLGDQVSIGANTVIGADCRIGNGSVVHPNVSIAHNVIIGERAIIHSGVVVGSDGFGYARDGSEHIKIAQLGGVRIGNDVEIGANTCIDRGALDDTVIGNDVKIDNQVQIAHNVTVGDHTVICGCSAVAGSARIGKRCVIAGGVGIINHVVIGDDVTVTAMSLVNQSIVDKGIYSSGTGISDTATWKKNIVRFRQLDEIARQVKTLLKQADKKQVTRKQK